MLITPPVLKQIPVQSSTKKKKVHDKSFYMSYDGGHIYLSDLNLLSQ